MSARRAAAVLLLVLAAAGAATLLLRGVEEAAPPTPPERPAAPELPEPREEPPAPAPEPVAVPGVVVEQREDELVATNDDGEWTILTSCRSEGDNTVGPGYVSRLVSAAGAVLVDDLGPRQPLNDPGYGGLGAFAWHHARGRPGALRLHADSAWEVSGRICARDNGGFGVSSARLLEPPAADVDVDEQGEQFVAFAVEVELSDGWTYPQPLMRVRYRYRVHRASVRSWIAVSELCAGGRCGDTSELAFVKEPKLAAGLRSDRPLPYSRAAVFDAEDVLRCIYVGGGPPEGPVLETGQCADPGRMRARFDAGNAESGADGGCGRIACLHVTMRAHPADDGDVVPAGAGAPWQNSGFGFDAWAEAASRRPPGLDRDTASLDGVLWDCHGGSPEGELLRRWETIARRDEGGRHVALAVLFTAWQGGRGGYDCEPLLRTFGQAGQTWGAFAEYSLDGEGAG